ncbi:eCIS core domain-containing protein [Sorangium sp. So ce861]|uniref:eCIS core domain-containing protein n=1 Tax=Sorangium sp. So ce861 TaxID=3133323 RepID=UPI003F623F59
MTAKEAAGIALQRRTARESAQLAAGGAASRRVEAAPAPNRTGLPDPLKAGIERLSGLPMDDVRVHYNSTIPAELDALAYTQGSEIHVAPGQERHVPHEAWHVVQQKQGRVRATTQLMGRGINDEPALEAEADRLGRLAARGDARAVPAPFVPGHAGSASVGPGGAGAPRVQIVSPSAPRTIVQRMIGVTERDGKLDAKGDGKRPPGAGAGGSQDDHTTAYVTFEHQIVNAIDKVTAAEAWDNLVATHRVIRRLPGYAESHKWLLKQSEEIYSANSTVDPSSVDKNVVKDYANDILVIRNRIALTSLKTTGGSTGGQNEATHAGGLQHEEKRLRSPDNDPRYTKDDIIESMMSLLDRRRLNTVSDDATRTTIVNQHVMSILDSYPSVVDRYGITEKDLLDYDDD